jgi:hypothetical protein
MMVSILLPTIRPDLFRIRMEEYASLDLPWPCEVVVVSDRSDLDVTPTHPLLSVKHFVQPRAGNVPATNFAFDKAEGRFVFATNDEVELDPHIFRALVCASGNGPAILSATQTPYCSNDYYGVFFANCPFGQRSFFQSLSGGFFDPVYHSFYADPDLALRAHAIGLSVGRVPDAKCVHHCVPEADGHVANSMMYYQQDRHTFTTRWAHLGHPPIDPSLR